MYYSVFKVWVQWEELLNFMISNPQKYCEPRILAFVRKIFNYPAPPIEKPVKVLNIRRDPDFGVHRPYNENKTELAVTVTVPEGLKFIYINGGENLTLKINYNIDTIFVVGHKGFLSVYHRPGQKPIVDYKGEYNLVESNNDLDY